MGMALPNTSAAIPNAVSSLSRVNIGLTGRDVGNREKVFWWYNICFLKRNIQTKEERRAL